MIIKEKTRHQPTQNKNDFEEYYLRLLNNQTKKDHISRGIASLLIWSFFNDVWVKMFFASQEIRNPLASELASDFCPFDSGIF